MTRKHGLILALILLMIGIASTPGAARGPQPPTTPGPAGPAPMTAVGKEFTYQGRLTSGGAPANGPFDFTFTLFDAATGGTAVGGPITLTSQTVTDGLFTVQLDFGSSAFRGDARWLEIAVRPAGGSTYTTLTPRQALTAAPYALSLRPGASVIGTSTNPIFSATNQGSGNALSGTGGTGAGVYAASTSGRGVSAISTSGEGVFGGSISNNGVHGLSYGDGSTVAGVYGEGAGRDGNGVIGVADNGTQAAGVYGSSSSGRGVVGYSSSVNGTGVRGDASQGSSPIGVDGYAAGIGVRGRGGFLTTGYGIYGDNTGGQGYGVYGVTSYGYGVYGRSLGGGYAGYFAGSVQVTGTLSKGGGSFKIDDPLDPTNKYLYHSFVESPDMMNIYNGNVTTDGYGDATVTMPAWFEALNMEFRYQLTPIGQFAQAMVASEIKGNQFTIKTDKPNVKISWQVTGIRHDAFAEAHRIPVEEDKPAGERGKYLYPTEAGQPASLGVDYARQQQQDQMQSPPTP